MNENFSLVSFTAGGVARRAESDILALSDELKRAGGVTLTASDVKMLAETQDRALRNYGRMEFGGGCVAALARAFCDSPDIAVSEFPKVLAELTEVFYDFRDKTDGKASDEELISAMRTAFDGSARGSVDLLSALSVSAILSIVENGREVADANEDADGEFSSSEYDHFAAEEGDDD